MKSMIQSAQKAIYDQFLKQPALKDYDKDRIAEDLAFWPYWEDGDNQGFFALDEVDTFEWITSRIFFHPGADRLTLQGNLLDGRLAAYVTVNLTEGGIVEHVEISKIGQR